MRPSFVISCIEWSAVERHVIGSHGHRSVISSLGLLPIGELPIGELRHPANLHAPRLRNGTTGIGPSKDAMTLILGERTQEGVGSLGQWAPLDPSAACRGP